MTLMEMFQQQSRITELIKALEKIRDNDRKVISEYEYASIITLIRCMKLKREILSKPDSFL